MAIQFTMVIPFNAYFTDDDVYYNDDHSVKLQNVLMIIQSSL